MTTALLLALLSLQGIGGLDVGAHALKAPWKGLSYAKTEGDVTSIYRVNEKTLSVKPFLTDVAVSPLRLVGHARKDRLRLDQPTQVTSSLGSHVRLASGAALFLVRHDAASSLVRVRVNGTPRILLTRPDGPGGEPGLLDVVHVAPSGQSALVASPPELGGDVFVVQLHAPFGVDEVTSSMEPLDLEPESLRVGAGVAWWVADGTLYRAALDGSAPEPVSLEVAEPVVGELVLASGNGAVAVCTEKPDGKRRLFLVPATGAPRSVTESYQHYSLPNYEHPLGPWIALNADATRVAWRKVGGDQDLYVALGLSSSETTVEPLKVTTGTEFPSYLDSIGVLAFGGPMLLCFFAGDAQVGDFEFDESLGAADMYVADLSDLSDAPSPSDISVANVTRTNGQASPPFTEPATLDFDEAFVGPRAERIYLVGNGADGASVAMFRIDGGPDSSVANADTLAAGLYSKPALAGGVGGTIVLSQPIAPAHAQPSSKVECTGDPAGEPLVWILASNKSDPGDSSAKVWFDGQVALGESFELVAQAADKPYLENDTWVHVHDASGAELLQSSRFHTSCSEVLHIGDRFGASHVDAAVGELAADPITDVCWYESKPSSITLRYDGLSCAASQFAQDSGKVQCTGDPMLMEQVRILVTDKGDPDDAKAKVWFDGTVHLGESFVALAAAAGLAELKSDTHVHVFDTSGALLQSVEFHTSCSQPIELGDRFGSVELVEFGIPDLDPANACLNGKPVRLTLTYTGDPCGDVPAGTEVRSVHPLCAESEAELLEVFGAGTALHAVATRRADGAVAIVQTPQTGGEIPWMWDPVSGMQPLKVPGPFTQDATFTAGGQLALVLEGNGLEALVFVSPTHAPIVIDVAAGSIVPLMP